MEEARCGWGWLFRTGSFGQTSLRASWRAPLRRSSCVATSSPQRPAHVPQPCRARAHAPSSSALMRASRGTPSGGTRPMASLTCSGSPPETAAGNGRKERPQGTAAGNGCKKPAQEAATRMGENEKRPPRTQPGLPPFPALSAPLRKATSGSSRWTHACAGAVRSDPHRSIGPAGQAGWRDQAGWKVGAAFRRPKPSRRSAMRASTRAGRLVRRRVGPRLRSTRRPGP